MAVADEGHLTKGMHPLGEIVEILTVPVPLQLCVDDFIGTAFSESLADPETAQRGVGASYLVIESADPAFTNILTAIAPQHPMSLIDQLCCAESILLVVSPLEQLKEVADREGVSPKVPSWILCSRT
jgi:hypothetical protein